jgi:hypothetical protein
MNAREFQDKFNTIFENNMVKKTNSCAADIGEVGARVAVASVTAGCPSGAGVDEPGEGASAAVG